MVMKTGLAQSTLAAFLLISLIISGCEDVNHHHDYYSPPIPSGVYTITGDGYVEILWSPLRVDDLDGYRIYRSQYPAGRYWQIGDSQDNEFIDENVHNGETYYYAVSAYDWHGNESDLSYETIHDTPRPQGYDLVIYDDDALAGVDFSGYYSHMIWPWNDPYVDLYLLWLNGRYCLASADVEYEGAVYGTDIQYAGYVNTLDEIDWAPESGWSTDIADTVTLYEGHAYVAWTWENNFAKFRVHHIGYDYVIIDWAFQIDEGNPELKRLPGAKTLTPADLKTPRAVSEPGTIPGNRPGRTSNP